MDAATHVRDRADQAVGQITATFTARSRRIGTGAGPSDKSG
jgi:hypothetical protein